MGRIGSFIASGVRSAARIPVPNALTTHMLQEARTPQPPVRVRSAHATQTAMIGRTRCVWLDEHHAERGVIVHLHGGAYVSGPFSSDWSWLSEQVDQRQCAGVMVDYRCAPDHHHPTALEDVEAALAELAASGVLSAGNWVLSGQQAGGGLAFVVARRIRENVSASSSERDQEDASHEPRQVPAPSAIIAVCPWLDLELPHTELTDKDSADQVHERRILKAAARSYAARTPLDDPDLSPINGDLGGLPPVHLSVGENDLSLVDVRLAKMQLEEAGVEVTYREVSGRVGMQMRTRRDEDAKRLFAEHSSVIDEAFSALN